MLCRPESKKQAFNVGIRAERAFAANEIKASIFVQSCRIHGFVPFITNLLRSSDAPSKEMLADETFMEYYHGVGHEIYGFRLSDEHKGLPYVDIVNKAYEKFNFLCIGVQISGRIMIT